MKPNRILLTLLALLLSTAFMPTLAQNRNRSTTARRTTPARRTTTKPATPVATTPKLVDLGLPSGTLWADRNVGATSTTDIGGYYAFGELDTKTTYMSDNYEGPETGINIAGTKYDVATKKYGEGWQIPSQADYQELLDNCKTETTMEGTTVLFKFTGPNGASIVLPFPKEYLFMRLKDYETSKQFCNSTELIQGLKQFVAAAKSRNMKLGVGCVWMTTCDCKLLVIIGAYGKDPRTGEQNGQAVKKIEFSDMDIPCAGFPIRAIFRSNNGKESDAASAI